MAEQEKTYDERAQEVQEAPDEGAGWEGASQGDSGANEAESAADKAETERADK